MWYFVTYHHDDRKSEIVCVEGDQRREHPGWSSMSHMYDTYEELAEAEGLQPACSLCGQAYTTKFTNGARLIAENRCFDCDFWLTLKPGGIVIAGRHYQIGPEPAPNASHAFLGMAGREFRIKFLADGREVVTHNLWHQGAVPLHLRDRFPDNAEFLGGAGFVKIGDGGAWEESR